MKDNKKKSESKPLTHRMDQWIQSAGVHLASKTPRRTFIGRVTTGIIALGSTSLILKPSDAQASLCGITECRGTNEISVCYAPWVVTAAGGVGVYKGPSFSAARVTDTSGVPITIPNGKHFGRCSNRGGSAGCPDPGPRPSYNGFIWGYWDTGVPRQGWIPYGAGYASGDNSWTGKVCGPADYDFDCRFASPGPNNDYPWRKSLCGLGHSSTGYVCGGSAAPSGTCSTAHWKIGTSGSDLSHERYYIRYGENSTTFGWLVPGDIVYRYGYAHGACCTACPGGVWSCVQAVCCAYVPNGCRGWTCSDILGSTTTSTGACFPPVPSCPN